MAVMSMWVTVWEIVLLAGIGSFLVLLVAIVPLGAIDIKRMFAKLDAAADPEVIERERSELAELQ